MSAPSSRDSHASTTAQQRSLDLPRGRAYLLIIGDGIATTHDLPDDGSVTIGRDYDCDVHIDHPSISRRHAVLHLGPSPRLEDVGSANGTRVRTEWLLPGAPVPLAVGEVADVGAAMIAIQRRPRPVTARRVWTHALFELRVAEECASRHASRRPFAVLRLHCGTPRPARTVETALGDALGADDLLAYFAPGEYEVLLVGAAPQAVSAMAAKLTAALDAIGADPSVGVATYPTDGRTVDALLAAASSAARQAVSTASPLVAADGPMARIYLLIDRVAPSPLSVLILGETGVGKEVVAERIHARSDRSARPFLRLNCAALSESLLESELFGHERGAFTGAAQAKPGLLEVAEGGTVFLDEVGEMPLALQVKLLRVLEERKVFRVGGLAPRPIDIRVLAATHRDLDDEIARGRLRQDLVFRLNGISIEIPPLRDRVGEIAPLARAFLASACEQWGRAVAPAITPEAMALLRSYAWPGNVRELRNVMERAVLLCANDPIAPEHLPIEKLTSTPARRSSPAPAPATALAPPPAVPTLDDGLDRDGRGDDFAHIVEALRQSAGNQTAAARMLGISRRTLINRLDAYNLPRPCKGRRGSSSGFPGGEP